MLNRPVAQRPASAYCIAPLLTDDRHEFLMMTSAVTADFELSRRLSRSPKLIATARSIDAVLVATATAARELAELEDPVRAELTGNAVPEKQVVISGPALRLTPRAAETLALAL